MITIPQKIAIFGIPGSGKSTAAFELQKLLSLPVYHLDNYFYDAPGIKRDFQAFVDIQQQLVNKDAWIIEGCSTRTLEMRYAKSDLFLGNAKN